LRAIGDFGAGDQWVGGADGGVIFGDGRGASDESAGVAIMLPKLYLETTIPSYLEARLSKNARLAADQEATKEWWDEQRSKFELYVSVIVLREVQRGDANFAKARLERIRDIPVLAPSAVAEDLAKSMLDAQIIPANAADDASHLAIAAANEMEFLLTWNCTHINNRYIIRRIEGACSAMGLRCPVICTPPELMNIIP
jgi:hypothetical protein